MSRVYFHVDLNAFFANAEILLDPELKGKPMVVSGYSRRSVVSTASYEARAYGIHSAMPVKEAQQLCRDLIIVEGHYNWYHELSEQFMKIMRGYTDRIEQASIDECYADMTDVIMRYPKPLDLAWEIQKRVLNEVHIPCSIGVGPNLFLAKMASDMKKPMGITVLRIRDVPAKMWPLPIGDMRGVGVKTVPLLKEIGIHTIGDLARAENNLDLQEIFGKNTSEIIRRANGYDDRQLITEWDAKSMGVSETLLDDITDYDEIKGLYRALSRKLSKRLREARKEGYNLSIRIRYYDFRNADRSVTLDTPVWKSDDIFVQAMSLFDENWNGDAIRLAGISVTGFDRNQRTAQLNLFDQKEADKEETVSVLKDLNKQAGTSIFMRASDILKE